MLIKGGKAALPGEERLQRVDVRVEGGIICEIGLDLEGEADIDASGLELYPGGIDPHVHFFDPGYTQKETFAAGSAAAASGGITTVIDMPCTSIPDVTSLENLRKKLSVVEGKAQVDFAFHGGISGQVYRRGFVPVMEELAPWVTGFKCYTVSGMESFEAVDLYQLTAILNQARRLGRPVLLHAEDKAWVDRATAVEQDRGDDSGNYYRSRPEMAELLAVEGAARAVRETGADLHVVHVGTAAAAWVISPVEGMTGETCPHYLAFTRDDLDRIGPPLKTAPVVKSPGNREGLWQALAEGALLYAASDHAPGTREEKHTDDIWKASSGIPGTGTLFPYLYSEGLRRGRLSLARFLEVTSGAAARRFGLDDRKGALAPGRHGDMVLMDPAAEWTVRGEDFLFQGKDTPWEGDVFQGKVVQTLLRGQPVYRDGSGRNFPEDRGPGRFLRPAVKDIDR